MPNLVPVEWALLSFVSVKPTHCPVLLGPLFGLSPAVGGRATIHPRCIAALTGLAEVALADATAVPIETFVAAASAEGAALILNRFGKPRTATQIATIVLSLVRRRACGRCGRAGRAIGAVLALASLSPSLGATAGRGQHLCGTWLMRSPARGRRS